MSRSGKEDGLASRAVGKETAQGRSATQDNVAELNIRHELIDLEIPLAGRSSPTRPKAILSRDAESGAKVPRLISTGHADLVDDITAAHGLLKCGSHGNFDDHRIIRSPADSADDPAAHDRPAHKRDVERHTSGCG